MVETSEGTTSPRGGIFTLEMVHFGAFSVAKEAEVTWTCPPSPLPNTTLHNFHSSQRFLHCSDPPSVAMTLILHKKTSLAFNIVLGLGRVYL